MINRPIYETPEERRKRQVGEFIVRYPHPMVAWAERQSPFWQIVLTPHLTPEGKAILVTGAFAGKVPKVPSMKVLWDYWFRAAWTMLVPKKKEDRGWDDLSAEALAHAFGFTRGHYQRLVKVEKKWLRDGTKHPSYLASVLPKLAKLPAIEELTERLLTLPAK
jgi:hypothetical protein